MLVLQYYFYLLFLLYNIREEELVGVPRLFMFDTDVEGF